MQKEFNFCAASFMHLFFFSFYSYCCPYGTKPQESCFLKVYQISVSFDFAQVY